MGWLDSPAVRAGHVLPAIARGPSTGDAWLDIVDQFHIDKQGLWLSLGCGGAGPEIAYAQHGLFVGMDAYDISPEAIHIARKNAAVQGVTNINFFVDDFDKMVLPAAHYDVVSMIMSLHHVNNLDALLRKISGTLKPDGWFLVNEYIGPSQFQFTDKQMQIVQRSACAVARAAGERLR